MSNLTIFAENLSALLKKRNIRQNKLAEMVGVQPTTITSYLKNTRDGNSKGINPSLGVVIEIAKVLNISLDELCGLSDGDKGLRKEDVDEAPLTSYLEDWIYLLQKGHISIEHVGQDAYGLEDNVFVPGKLTLRVQLKRPTRPNYVLSFFEDYQKLKELRDSRAFSEELYKSSLSGLIDRYRGYKITSSGEIVTDNEYFSQRNVELTMKRLRELSETE